MYAEQQRFWLALLNLHRTWGSDDAALAFIPPRHRDFDNPPDWSWPKAQAYLLNNIELLRESLARVENGQPVDVDLINLVLSDCALRLHAWPNLAELRRAAKSKADLGSRVEALQVTSDSGALNPGTRYIRATVQRAFYYFAQYVDHRVSDPIYPEVSPERWRVVQAEDGSGDLTLVEPRQQLSPPTEIQ